MLEIKNTERCDGMPFPGFTGEKTQPRKESVTRR